MPNFTTPPQHPGYPQQDYPAQLDRQPQITPALTYSRPAPPPPPMPPRDTPIRVECPSEECCSFNQKQKSLGYGIGTAALIFMSGGINIAWAVGFKAPLTHSFSKQNSTAWFIGAIIGALITCGLTKKVPKKWVLLFSSLLVTIGGLVIACTHQNGSGTVAACFLDGVANGLVFAPFMALAAELSVAYKRGTFVSSLDQISFGIGILLLIVCSSSLTYGTDTSDSSFTADNIKGVLSTILGFLALILGSFITMESPVLANNDETGAIDALRRLQKPAVLTEETYDQLTEHKSLTLGQSIGQALPTFLRLGYLRALNAMSLSSYLEYTFFISIFKFALETTIGSYIDFAFFRLMGTVLSSFCSDFLGRKRPTLLGLLVSAGMAFAIPGHFLNQMSVVTNLLLFFAFFTGVAFAPSSAYISEAYPLGVKQHFISFTFIVEMFVFLIIQVCDFNHQQQTNNYFYIMAGMYLGGFILAGISFPETKPISMRGAREHFSRFFNTRF